MTKTLYFTFGLRSLRPLALSLSVLSLAACATNSDAPLSSADLQRKVSGNSFAYTGTLSGMDLRGQMQFNENGNLFVETESGIPEGGTWRILDDQMCLSLVALTGGEELCFDVLQTGRTSFKTSNGFEINRLGDK